MRKTLVIVAIVVTCLTVAGPAAVGNDRPCSTAAVAGRWGFTANGFIGAAPVAAVGSSIVDTAGHVTGSQTRSFGGAIALETLVGNISLNSDCTGAFVVQVFQNGTLVRTTNLYVVLDDRNSELRMIFLTPGTVIVLEARRMVQAQ